jgi:hypothetical protein
MAGTRRNTTEWRQGHVLTIEAATALDLISARGPENTFVVVVSHDCDIACDDESEPTIEVIVGFRIDRLGGDTHAKTARRLHLAFRCGEDEVPVELRVSSKCNRPKGDVLQFEPRADLVLSPESLVTLQHWLAARYHRAAFADEFESRLKAKPVRLDRKIAKALNDAAQHVLAVFFDVDDGEEVKRDGPGDVYQLRVTVLYESAKDEPKAYKAAQGAADAIEREFEKAFLAGGQWHDIRLVSCEAVSDSAMTVAESRMLKRWRLDHMSLEEEPLQPMFEPD